jgi:hypothetical protein
LIFTNHHCGYDAVAAASTPEKDYLKNGFWAMKPNEEFNAKGLYVRFLVRMDDVSERINSKLNNNMSAADRKAVIDAEYKAIQAENSENGKYTVVVRDFSTVMNSIILFTKIIKTSDWSVRRLHH